MFGVSSGLGDGGADDEPTSLRDGGGLGASDGGLTRGGDARVAPARTDAGMSPPMSNGAPSGLYKVKDGLLYDGCGEEVVLRGVNHPTLYVDRAGKAMAEIGKTGANAVRLFWYAGNGIKISEAESSITAAVKSGLLPMLEMHDSTCKWELDRILDYWTSAEAVALIKRHEKHLLVNIANEATPPSSRDFLEGYTDAIEELRAAGIHTPLVIDGGRCGRDYQVLLEHGATLLERDPDHNLVFSAHLYDPLSQSQLAATFDKFRKAKLPFIVGEFANREPPGCGKPLDYAAVMAEAQRAGIGWLAWSWGDNDANTLWNTDCGEFDMTSTFAFDSLWKWGREVAMTHAASINKTAKRPYSLSNGDRCK